jgi:hypothetical protein
MFQTDIWGSFQGPVLCCGNIHNSQSHEVTGRVLTEQAEFSRYYMIQIGDTCNKIYTTEFVSK